jgi:hypothetical protein
MAKNTRRKNPKARMNQADLLELNPNVSNISGPSEAFIAEVDVPRLELRRIPDDMADMADAAPVEQASVPPQDDDWLSVNDEPEHEFESDDDWTIVEDENKAPSYRQALLRSQAAAASGPVAAVLPQVRKNPPAPKLALARNWARQLDAAANDPLVPEPRDEFKLPGELQRVRRGKR